MYGLNSVYFNFFSVATVVFLTWNMNNSYQPILEVIQVIPESNLGDFSRCFKWLTYLLAQVIYEQVMEQPLVST